VSEGGVVLVVVSDIVRVWRIQDKERGICKRMQWAVEVSIEGRYLYE
jgi:hypothetical protein